ncbi:hypothetical protein [Epilithonimonas sp.]|uniref:hypothetical protein n=1 Tax=Epilithonimonas sp. TaxID=2894511 RepID=UPI00289735A9|nr:hypothetical protein [Epilithonimonas sp.]
MNEIIDKNVEYWKDLWKNLIDNFLKKSYGLSLYNPHILIEDIILEIEENNFSNDDNKKFFYAKLNEYFEKDNIIKKTLSSEFKLLRNIFNSNNKNNLILEVCKNINQKFKNGEYFEKCIEELKAILFESKTIDKNFVENINYLSQNIIIEFIKKGYVLKDIQKFIDKIFDTYSIINLVNGDVIKTSFPHNISDEEFTINGTFNKEGLNKKIIETIENLDLNSRIESLKNFYKKELKEAYYIFIVEGLTGEIDIQIGNVNLYSLKKKRYVINDANNEEELQQGEDDDKFIQVSVKVCLLSNESSLHSALTILENTIDLIHCYYNTKTKLEINYSKYIIVKDGRVIQTSWSNNNKPFLKLHNSLKLNIYKNNFSDLDKYSFIINNSESDRTVSKLLNAIHWYSKAEHSTKQEDKLLNYWIAIENLINSEYETIKNNFLEKDFKKIKLIQSVVSANHIFKFIYDYGWEYYYHYDLIIRNKRFNKYEIPNEIIEKANLQAKEGQIIYLRKFINSLEDIKKYEVNPFHSDKIDNLINFYNNNDFTMKVINKQIKDINDDVLMIYRFRNLIVHNAHYDNALLPYYIWKIKEYSGNLIRVLIHEYTNKKSDLKTLLTNIFIKKETFLIDLKDYRSNLFNDDEND